MSVFSTEEDMRDERAFIRLVDHEPNKTTAEESKSEERQIEEAMSDNGMIHRCIPLGDNWHGRQQWN